MRHFTQMIFILLTGIFVVVNADNKDQNLTRQCRSYEVEECMFAVWRDRNCEYGNGTGSYGYSTDDKAAETLTSFSMKFLVDSYTPDTVGDEIYFHINDPGFISTNDFKDDEGNFGQCCFIQETVKCFRGKSCDIQNHNEVFGELYSASKNVLKMLFNVIKQFIKEKFRQVKGFFGRTFL